MNYLTVTKSVDDIIAQIGEEVELEALDVSGSVDTWYDIPESYTTSTITVIIDALNRMDIWFQTGILQEGDLIIYTQTAQTINIRDRIKRSDIYYEVVKLDKSYLQGSLVYQKVGLKREITSTE